MIESSSNFWQVIYRAIVDSLSCFRSLKCITNFQDHALRDEVRKSEEEKERRFESNSSSSVAIKFPFERGLWNRGNEFSMDRGNTVDDLLIIPYRDVIVLRMEPNFDDRE